MASEANVRVEKSDDVRWYTVADGTAIAKGSLLVMSSDPRTAVKHSAAGEYPLGFAVNEKEANDGQVKMGVQRAGVVDAVAKGAIILGYMVIPGSDANEVAQEALS